MKKPKDHLHRLISSMTPSEKRYYKMHFGQSSGMLSELYEIVNTLEIYDETIVKQHLGDGSKNLKVYKIQLTELLLKSLTLFHHKKKIKNKIRIGLEEIDILIDKELYEMASERLEKLKKLCQDYQEYTYLIEIIYHDFRLHHIQFDKLGHTVIPIYEQLKSYIEKLEEQHKYAELGNRILEMKRKNGIIGFSEAEIEYCRELLKSDFLQDSYTPHSIRAELSRNTLLTFLNDIIGNKTKSIQYRKNSVAVFQANPLFSKHQSFDYLNTLRNLVNIYIEEYLFEEAEHVIEEAESFAAKNKIQREQLVYFVYSQLVIEYLKGNFEKIAIELTPKIIGYLNKYEIKQNRIGLVSYLYLAITNVLLQRHKFAQEYLRELYSASRDLQKYFTEIYTIVELMSHFESKDFVLMKSLNLSKNRQLAQSEQVSIFYRSILQLFKKLADQPFNAAKYAKEILAQLPNFEKDKVLGIFLYFKLQIWLRALANHRSFVEEMRADNKNA